jgi:hypothetical protein
MKTFALISTILTALVAALLFVPALQGSTAILAGVTLLLAILSVIFITQIGSEKSPAPRSTSTPEPAAPVPVPVPAAVPPPVAPAASAEAEILAFLGLLQEKGRLVDFLMDDITPYEDAQVGAAARVVHQGCRAVLQEHFAIAPVCTSGEGSTVTVPTGDESADYRLVGRLSGEPPFTGTLVHKGWKTTTVKLPRVVASKRLPALTPAEVELR